MSYRIYTAGPMADRPAVREIAQKLRDSGYVVDCRWLDVSEETPEGLTREAYLHQQALNDIEDLLKADALVYVNSRKSEGKATELGIALATLKPIVIIGDRSNNVFLNLSIPAFQTIEEAIAWMATQGGPQPVVTPSTEVPSAG